MEVVTKIYVNMLCYLHMSGIENSKGKYISTIGLEVHAELKTNTKMFCDSKNDTEETRPNVNICPVCMGHPGTLPVINKEAVKNILKIGYAVNGNIANFTEFDRKNYFYPDIPKGYQISQYEYPLVSGGKLAEVDLTRIHLEEDTARSVHSSQIPEVSSNEDYSLVNFNRAGIPLMELVTEPVIRSGEKASEFARELQLLLRYLGIGEANMEKGEMRVEANVSVSRDDKLGNKVEVKNLNSFRSVGRAIDYEIERHVEKLEAGGDIDQETRGWDENKQKTISQRVKEEAHDYRYFPDPDLPKLKVSEVSDFNGENIKEEMPVLPWQKREMLAQNYDLKDEEVEIFVNNPALCVFFENTVFHLSDNASVRTAINYIITDLNGLLKNESIKIEGVSITPEEFAGIIRMTQKGDISSRGAKELLKKMFPNGGDPEEIAEKEGLLQKSDEDELNTIIDGIIAENPQATEEFKSGKEESLKFLIGQGMKVTKGAANPQVLDKLFREKLSG